MFLNLLLQLALPDRDRENLNLMIIPLPSFDIYFSAQFLCFSSLLFFSAELQKKFCVFGQVACPFFLLCSTAFRIFVVIFLHFFKFISREDLIYLSRNNTLTSFPPLSILQHSLLLKMLLSVRQSNLCSVSFCFRFSRL